jgi:hypothetical protein
MYEEGKLSNVFREIRVRSKYRTNAHCDEDLHLLFSEYTVNYGDYTDFVVDELIWRISCNSYCTYFYN